MASSHFQGHFLRRQIVASEVDLAGRGQAGRVPGGCAVEVGWQSREITVQGSALSYNVGPSFQK